MKEDVVMDYKHIEQDYLVPLSTTLELKITSNNQRSVPFPTNKTLNGAHILGAFVRTQDGSNNQKSITGQTLAADSVVGTAFLVLARNNKRVLDYLPLKYLDFENLAGDYVQLDLPNGFDTSQSSVELSTNGASADTSIEITFIYIDK